MSWLAVFLIGLALGWALELIIDIWFWGRRYRRIKADLGTCRTNFRASEKKIDEIQGVVARYQAEENKYQQCQYDLANLAQKQRHLEALSSKMSNEIDTSKKYAHQLNEEIDELKAEREHLSTTVEEVNQWVESSFRQRIWQKVSWFDKLNRHKERSATYVRSLASTGASRVESAANRIKNSAADTKVRINRVYQATSPKRLLNKGRCAVWALIALLNKKSAVPDTCSIGPDQQKT